MERAPAPTDPLHLAILARGEPGRSHGGAGVPAPDRRPSSPWRRPLSLGAVFGGAFLAAWLLAAPAVPAAFRHLPGEERTALVERTLANLKDICRRGDRPREYCKEQAILLLALPECAEACRADARAELLVDMALR